MQRHFNNATAHGKTYRKGMGDPVPHDLIYTDYLGRTRFWCSVSGGLSGSSSSPRTEYRETMADSAVSLNWLPYSFRYNAMIGVCSIGVTVSKGKVIFAQIHGFNAPTPFVKLLHSNGSIYAEVRATPSDAKSPVVLRMPYTIGDRIDFGLNISNKRLLTIGLNGVSHDLVVDEAWDDHPFYFKAGAYLVAPDSSPDESTTVIYSTLEVYHGDGRDAEHNFRAAARKYFN